MATAAWFVVTFNAESAKTDWSYDIYVLIVYGSFGFVIGAMLPAAIHNYRDLQQNQMPQSVATLYNELSRYFYDYGQFNG